MQTLPQMSGRKRGSASEEDRDRQGGSLFSSSFVYDADEGEEEREVTELILANTPQQPISPTRIACLLPVSTFI